MATKTRQIPVPFEGLNTTAATASTPIANLPIGPRYHALFIKITGTKASAQVTLAELLGNIRVKINGQTQRNITAARSEAINTLYGAGYAARVGQTTTAAGAKTATVGTTTPDTNDDHGCWRVPIYFAEPWRKDYAAQVATAWPTAWPNGKTLASFQVECDIPGTASCSVSSIELIAVTDDVLGDLDAKGNPVMNIVKQYTHSFTSATGDVTFLALPKRDWLLGANIFMGGTDTCTDLEVKVDNRIIHKLSKQDNDCGLINNEFNTSGFSAYRYDFVTDFDDVPTSALNLNGTKDVQLKMTCSGTAAAYIVSNYYGPPD